MQVKVVERELEKISEGHKHFIAGLIEGEGCFIIYKNSHARQSGKGKVYYYTAGFCLSNTNFAMIKYLRETLRIGQATIEPYQTRKPMAKFSITNEVDLLAFLNVLIPYLKWKRTEAELLVEWIISRMPKFRKQRGYSTREKEIYHLVKNIKSFSMPKAEVLGKREEIRRELNAL